MMTLGYTIFTVPNVESALQFFSDAFGTRRKLLTPEGDYGELDTGPTTLAFVRNDLAHENLDQSGGFIELSSATPPIAASVTLLVDDVRAAVDRAVEAGASVYVEPVDKPWGQTTSYVRAPNGTLVELATPVEQ